MKKYIDVIRNTIMADAKRAVEIKRHGEPVLYYSVGVVNKTIEYYRMGMKACPNVKLYFAEKANYSDKMLSIIRGKVDGIDTASTYELAIALNQFKPENISINGPGYTTAELIELQRTGFNIDVNSLAQLNNMDSALPVGIRIAEVEGDKKISRFGINIFNSESINLIKTKLVNRIHIHFGEKTLGFINKLESILCVLKSAHILQQLHEINLGGGFMKLAGQGNLEMFFSLLFDLYKRYGVDTNIVATIIEPGRGLVSFSGILIADVEDMDTEDGVQLITLNASCFKIGVWFPPKILTYTHKETSMITTSIFGNTCFEDDVFCKNQEMYKLSSNSSFVLFPVGAYTQSNHTNLHTNFFYKESILQFLED